MAKNRKLHEEVFCIDEKLDKRLSVSVDKGRREPQGPAKVLIKIADTHPEVLWEINKNDTQLA